MMNNIFTPIKKISILSSGTIVGKREFEGPLGSFFDMHDPSDRFESKSWETAESEMQKRAFNLALSSAKLKADEIEYVFSGDLQNQCVASTFGTLEFGIPNFGLYGACSTFVEGLLLASFAIEANAADNVSVVCSSHNLSAERQFRTPVEYGGQKTPTSQWTVTGAGAFILGDKEGEPYIAEGLAGRIVDGGINDASNMGAAMAPAAADTLCRYFENSGNKPADFDMILTGDLAREGGEILKELMKSRGYDIYNNHEDCGKLIFDPEKQNVHSGGSGCACSATVFGAYIMKKLKAKELRDILLVATGALMSPSSVQQGNTIPGIAHLVRIKA